MPLSVNRQTQSITFTYPTIIMNEQLTEEEQKEYSQLKEKPYEYICNYVESVYPQTGRKVFEIASLMPVSLIIPDIPYENKTVRSNISLLLLAPPSSGKSSIAELFARITYDPLELKRITSAELLHTIKNLDMFSLIIDDFARTSKELSVIKLIEGIIGEEKKISDHTRRVQIDQHVEGIAFLGGVANDLHFYLLNGLVFRVVPVLIGHTYQEHAKIGNYIKDRIGIEEQKCNKEKLIKLFYEELLQIQGQEHETIKEIKGYNIPKEFRDKAYQEWEAMTNPIVREMGFNWFRELQEFFRFLITHCFLNIHKRIVKNGILETNYEDFQIALKLMKRTIIFKYRLMKSEIMAKGISSAQEFQRILNSEKVPEEYKMILRNLVNTKSGGKRPNF